MRLLHVQHSSPQRLLLLLFCTVSTWSSFHAHEDFVPVGSDRRLYRHLTRFYDPDSRPIRQGNRAVAVDFLLIVKQIQDLDEKNQILMTNMLVKEEWTDENLRWEPHHFNNLTNFILPAYKVGPGGRNIALIY